MHIFKLGAGALAFAAASAASAGQTVGLTVGSRLGGAVGIPVGDLPVAGSSVLLIGAVALGLGIYLARRKRRP